LTNKVRTWKKQAGKHEKSFDGNKDLNDILNNYLPQLKDRSLDKIVKCSSMDTNVMTQAKPL
jgi:hypothetical protein